MVVTVVDLPRIAYFFTSSPFSGVGCFVFSLNLFRRLKISDEEAMLAVYEVHDGPGDEQDRFTDSLVGNEYHTFEDSMHREMSEVSHQTGSDVGLLALARAYISYIWG